MNKKDGKKSFRFGELGGRSRFQLRNLGLLEVLLSKPSFVGIMKGVLLNEINNSLTGDDMVTAIKNFWRGKHVSTDSINDFLNNLQNSRKKHVAYSSPIPSMKIINKNTSDTEADVLDAAQTNGLEFS